MLDRILEQRRPVTIILTETDLDNLSNSEWNLVDAIIDVLEPFEWATRALSADKYATLSMIIPLMSSILIRLREIKSPVTAAENVRKALIKAVENRFNEIENDQVITSACLLDPRFKTNMFISTSSRIAAVEALRTELSKLESAQMIESVDSAKESESPVEVDAPVQATKRRKLDFWATVAVQCDTSKVVNSYSSQLDNFLAEPCVNREVDVIRHWEENKFKYPLLFELSLKYLCIPATSCSSERVFSKAGEIVSAKRSRLKPKNVNNLIFLNKNYSKLN